jgi:hypothetical protein
LVFSPFDAPYDKATDKHHSNAGYATVNFHVRNLFRSI